MDPHPEVVSADLALASALASTDADAPLDVDDLVRCSGASQVLVEAVIRERLLRPHHIDDRGVARYSMGDLEALRAGLRILEAGLPLSELIALSQDVDASLASIAEASVDAFQFFVRDPAIGTTGDPEPVEERLVTAFTVMLPAALHLVAHQLRRSIIEVAAQRLVKSPSTNGDTSP
jgi:DNA-binding transcriptional MerR regulator